jgi:hypothetical protein
MSNQCEAYLGLVHDHDGALARADERLANLVAAAQVEFESAV